MLNSAQPFIVKFRSIDHLRQFDVKKALITDADRRRKARICAIDDEEFAPADQLRDQGFDIVHLKGIKRLEEVEPYPKADIGHKRLSHMA